MAVHRAYDNGLKRWVNRDPIGETGGLNIYDHVQNQPVIITDRLGQAGTGAGGSGAGATKACPAKKPPKPIGINPITGQPIYYEPTPFGPIYYEYRPDGTKFVDTPFPPADS